MTTLAPIQVDAEPQPLAQNIPNHIQLAKLGFESLNAYRHWCRHCGLDDGLAKGLEEEDGLERHLGEALAPKRPLTEERRQTLKERTSNNPAEWWPEVDKETRQAFLRLLFHVDSFINVLSSRKINRHSRYKHLLPGLLALAYHHRRWIRPLEAWRCVRPKDGHPRRVDQFFALANYLLARYQVPSPLSLVWLEGVDQRGLQQQEWFMHLANGGNIRDLDTPIKLTRRMAHLFWRAPRLGTLEKSMRWAQVIGMGGNDILAQAILKTRLGRDYKDEPFWSTVVLFLVNNAMMDATWAGPIVDYIHNMKFAPRRVVQEGGGVQEMPPPQPNFTMKGRSATKLLRQVEAWHGHLSREQYVDFQSWQSCGVRPFALEEETPALGPVRWTAQELLSSWELAAEGRAMSHCVVSYSNQCADGNTAIWSICAQQQGAPERENVLTVALDIKERTVTQARGRYNALPNKPPKSGQLQGGYLQLLNRSEHFLQMWMARERLRYDG